tara:strand:- start:4770 stop:5423 length:654 start_codon:yes stop_codon:yes gene_type:complete
MFLVLLEEGMRSAGDYAKATGRDVITQEDILYGLQYQAHQIQNIDNIQERSKEAITAWDATDGLKEFKNKTLVMTDGDEKWDILITDGGFIINDYIWKGVISNDSQSYGFKLKYQYLGEGECELEGDFQDILAEKVLDFLFEELVETLSEEDIEDEKMTVENHEPFKRAHDSHSEQIALMNFYHDRWNEWVPNTDVEKLLKETIDSRLTETLIEDSP